MYATVPTVAPGLVSSSSAAPVVASRCATLAPRVATALNFGQPEIQNLGVPALGHKNIRRLDVAVNDALRVRRVQPIRNLNAQIEQRLQIHRPPADPMLQRHAVQNSMAMKAWPFSSPMS